MVAGIFDFSNFDQGTGIPDATTTRIEKTNTNRFEYMLKT
jgi:hypothetical protein